jgi:hypothetical protein
MSNVHALCRNALKAAKTAGFVARRTMTTMMTPA